MRVAHAATLLVQTVYGLWPRGSLSTSRYIWAEARAQLVLAYTRFAMLVVIRSMLAQQFPQLVAVGWFT